MLSFTPKDSHWRLHPYSSSVCSDLCTMGGYTCPLGMDFLVSSENAHPFFRPQAICPFGWVVDKRATFKDSKNGGRVTRCLAMENRCHQSPESYGIKLFYQAYFRDLSPCCIGVAPSLPRAHIHSAHTLCDIKPTLRTTIVVCTNHAKNENSSLIPCNLHRSC